MAWAAFVFPACDEGKTEAPTKASSSATGPAIAPSVAQAPTPPVPVTTFNKKLASDCKPHPAAVDFGDDAALEHEVRRKLGKDQGPITPAQLASIKSINLASTAGLKLHQIEPCIFPMFTSLKDLFLPEGDYDDLTPIQRLTTLESLRAALSQVKNLKSIEGLKRLDRLDLSHTKVGDDDLKSVGGLVNLTELMLDEDAVSDLSPLSNLKKLERLSIKKTQVKNLAPIGGLRTLKYIYIADAPVSDITPVQALIAAGTKLVQN